MTDTTDHDELRRDYESSALTVDGILDKHGVARRTLYVLIRRHGWRQRNPRRIDRANLVERLLSMVERQILRLEEMMDKNETDESAVLSKLSLTLDRLFTLKQAAEAPADGASNALMDEIRRKVAKRIASLNGH